MNKQLCQDIMQSQKQQIQQIFEVCDEDSTIVWKILIFDQFSQDILSTLYKVGNLREKNITLHLNIKQQREQLLGVKTVYLVQPTEENIQLILKDFESELYENIYINFTSAIEENLLEKFAVGVGKSNGMYKVKRVLQHEVNFIALNRNLFSFNLNNIYSDFLKSDLNQKSSSQCFKIAQSLFSFCKTLSIYPVIYYTAKNKNSQKILDHLRILINKDLSNDTLGNHNQPILLLVDRDEDTSSLILHPWHYGALIHDLLGIRNNKVEMKNAITNNQHMVYDLDPLHDKTWTQKLISPFIEVAEQSSKEVEELKTQMDSMSHKQSSKDTEQMTQNINNALDQVSELQERKRRVDMYTNLSTHIINEIQNRQLDQYLELGSTLIKNRNLNVKEKTTFMDLLKSQKGSQNDKLRLILLFILNDELANNERIDNFIKAANIQDPESLKIIQLFKAKQSNIVQNFEVVQQPQLEGQENQQLLQQQQTNNNTNQTTQIEAQISGLFKGIANSVKNKSKELLINVQNQFTSQDSRFQLTNLVYGMLKQIQKQEPLNEKKVFEVFDFLQDKNVQKTKNFNDFIVFVQNGGNYNEYINLVEIGQKFDKNIIYGSSEMMNANDLLNQLKIFISN